jgi:hypothetical protein
MPAIHFDKRDDDGYVIPKGAIVVLVILGSGLLVCMGYAVYHLSGGEDKSDGYKARSVEQDDYMREVRQTTLNNLMHDMRANHKRPKMGESR